MQGACGARGTLHRDIGGIGCERRSVSLWNQGKFAQRHRRHRVYEKISDPVEPEKIHTET